MSSSSIALATLLISSVLWASAGTVAKLLLPTIDPMPLAMLRLAVANAVLLPMFFFKHKPAAFFKALPDVFPAALSLFGNIFFFFLGISRTTANAAGIIYTATPLLVFFWAKSSIKEHNDPKKLVGIVIGLVGALFILLLPALLHKQSINGDFVGNILIMCALFSWTYYIVGTRKLITQKHYEPITITTIAMAVTFLCFSVLTALVPHRPVVPVLFTGATFVLILYFGALVTATTYLLHQWAIKHSSAAAASLTSYIQPVFGFTMNAVFLGERLTPEFIFGSSLVLVGTIITTENSTMRMVHRVASRLRRKLTEES